MTNTRDLLWELGVEEVPARFLPPVIEQLDKMSREALAAYGLHYNELHIYATPRRLTLLVNGLVEKGADTETEQKGPSLKAAFDENGAPTKALQGFCRSQGVEPDALQQRELNGNIYVFAIKKNLGRATAELLPELLNGVADKLYFPKPMRWGYNSRRFVRPVRWIVALFGNDVIDLEFAGVHADRYTRGHRLLGSDHIELHQPSEYLAKLKENYVICDQQERREICWQQINQTADALGGHVENDDELLEEVTFILEYPTALAGCFEEKYLAIPDELIITPMREHQRYFPVYDQEGKLLPRFITVRNGDGRYLKTVAAGNEKVLRARLADAEFFYTEDLKDNLEEKTEQLSNVVFHEKLGMLRQKVERIIVLSAAIGKQLGYSEQELAQTRRAALLAKADLGSRVVYEFPELQGIIGEDYALAAGEDAVVAQAIREHYQPRFAGDELPESKPGIAVALADKLDSVCGFFSIGMIPSGSQDPYALRRAAAGCVNIITNYALRLELRELLPLALKLIENDVNSDVRASMTSVAERQDSIIRFMQQRLETVLAERGIAYDAINAVGAIGIASAELYGTMQRAEALNSFRGDEQFKLLLAGFVRAANIVRSAAAKHQLEQVAVDAALFRDESEKELHGALMATRRLVDPLIKQDEFTTALAATSKLTAYINKFFDAVMVMDKEEAVRNNRIALLQEILALTAGIGDLSQIAE